MTEIQIDAFNIGMHSQGLKNVREEYKAEREGIGEVTYSGIGKVADVMQETEEIGVKLLDLLDELYGRSISLLEYVAKTWYKVEEETAYVLQG